jgi:hypothetical protein
MARLEELQRQYVRRNKAKYPHTSREPSSSNQQANQATNALLPTPQGPKRNVPSFFDQNRSGQPARNVSSSATTTNQQVVQGKSATNQQAVQGKSAPNEQTVQGFVARFEESEENGGEIPWSVGRFRADCETGT